MRRFGARSSTYSSAREQRPSCGPTRIRAATGTKPERYSASSLKGVAVSPPSTPWIESSRCSGTNTSSATVVLLPEPLMPAVNQVSSMVSSDIGMNANASPALLPSASTTGIPSIAQSACRQPLDHGQRPFTM